MERSIQEKTLLATVFGEEPLLPYPLEKHHDEKFGDEYVYIIPEEIRLEVLKKYWVFDNIPDADTELFDIHHSAKTKFKNCQIIRWNNRNLLVSEFYFLSGGCSIDLVREDGPISVQVIKR